jgi:TonB-linked SusC/RagA family outer membrane protein
MKKPLILLLIFLLGKFLFCPTLNAQIITVSGVVTNISGQILPGAVIVETGNSLNSAVADSNGEFKISLAPTASIDVMFFGMETQTVKIDGLTSIIVALREDIVALDEIVVTGYGNITKESYTGSALTIGASKLDDRTISSFEEALGANVAGVLGSTSGQPGEATEIMLRGFGSLEGSNQPLYVIDGIVWDKENVSGSDNIAANPLSALNPSDIASITVLKDAASASLYGSRGANGVVIVTTKSGHKDERFRIDVSTINGFSALANLPDIINGQEYANLWVEGYMNHLIHNALSQYTASSSTKRKRLAEELKYMYADKSGYLFEGQNFYQWQKLARQEFNTRYAIPTSTGGYNNYDYFGLDWKKLPSTDWFKEISRVAPFTKNTISVRGGLHNVNYYASMEYYNQQGTIINSSLERYSMRMKFHNNEKDKFFTWGVNTYLSYTIQDGPYAGGLAYMSPMYGANTLPAVIPARLEDGTYNLNFPDNLLNGTHNPLASANEHFNKRLQVNITVNGEVGFRFTDWLRLNSRVTMYYYNFRRKSYYASYFGAGLTAHGSLNETFVNRSRLTNTNMLNIDKKWSSGHNITAAIGIEIEDLDYKISSMSGQGFATDDNPYMTMASSLAGYRGDGFTDAMFSLISNINYSFKNRYLFGASFRRDYSSRFAPDHRAGNFWSVSAGYDIAKERYMLRARRYINRLKVKGSYGINGTQPTQRLYWQNLYDVVNYNTELGASSTYRHRPDLTWEGNRIWNIGVDVSFLRDKISVGVEYYQRKSSNMFQNVIVPRTSGYSTYLMNTDAGILNKGIELTASTNILRKGIWNWDVKLNMSTLSSTYYGIKTQYYDSKQRQLVASGLNVYTWYLREFEGIDPETGEVLTGIDYKTDKQGVPKVFGGFESNLSWGRWTLSALFSYGLGHYIYDYLGAVRQANDGASNFTIARSQLDRWTPENTNAANPLRIYGTWPNTRSDRYLTKGDYVKLKNIKLNWHVNKELYRKLGMSNAWIYLQAENPWVLCKFKNYDPEMSPAGYREADRYPSDCTVTLGISTRF